MRIAQICPLFECVPPGRYGGTERVVAGLADGLVALGHEVTLFAAAGSHTRAELEAGCLPLRPRDRMADADREHERLLSRLFRRRRDFDVIHFHTELFHLPFLAELEVPHLTTLHGRVDVPATARALTRTEHGRFVSISRSQRALCPDARWLGTIHHGLAPEAFPEGPGGDGLVFVGRTSPEKGLDRAIRIARAAGMPLRIAAKISEIPEERAWFESEIRPQLGDDVQFLGEVDDAGKAALLGRARALLFPICWPEPFGLVLIEALACGTPVIAFPVGSVPEIVEHGVTGLVVRSEEEAVEACHRIGALDRHRCRRAFLERFGVRRMVADYVALYESLLEKAATPRRQALAESASVGV